MTQEGACDTYDGALEWFHDEPTGTSAANLLTIATKYWNDDMIGDETYSDAIRKVRDWLIEPVPTLPSFVVEYSLTERSVRRIRVEAETAEEAVRLVEEGEVELGESVEIDSLEHSVSDVRLGALQI